jgi:hypothetical protein
MIRKRLRKTPSKATRGVSCGRGINGDKRSMIIIGHANQVSP